AHRGGTRSAGAARVASRLSQLAIRRLADRPAPRAGAGLHGAGRTPAAPGRHCCRDRLAGFAAGTRDLPACRVVAGTNAAALRRHARRAAMIRLLLALLLIAAALAAGVLALNLRGEDPIEPLAGKAGVAANAPADAAQVERGRYLALAG